MIVLICGGRDYTDHATIDFVMQQLIKMNVWCIVHGAARGADSLAAECAEAYGVPTSPFPANWDKYGKSAGSRRNTQMIKEGNPDLVVAFPGGNGTANMIRQAKQHGIRVIDL